MQQERDIWAMYKINDASTIHCLECGEPLYGRTDKRFCSGQCRSKYHRHISYSRQQLISGEMDALLKNYSVLQQLLPLQSKRCPIAILEAMGFRKEFVTRVTKKGKHLEYRCFDISYSISSGFLTGLGREG